MCVCVCVCMCVCVCVRKTGGACGFMFNMLNSLSLLWDSEGFRKIASSRVDVILARHKP